MKYVIHCSKCKRVIEADKRDESPCPPEPKNKKIEWSPHSRGPSFTERLYANGGFYHAGIGEVVHSEKHLKQRCAELGFNSKHEGASMTARQERQLMAKRVAARPREVVQKPTWSGKGASLPVFETYEKSD